MSIDETLSRSSTIQEMSWKAERTMSIVLAKHLIGVTQHPSTIIVRVVVRGRTKVAKVGSLRARVKSRSNLLKSDRPLTALYV